MSIEYEIEQWDADTEAFRGDVLNDYKMKRLARMRTLCVQITEADPHIEAPTRLFDTHCRHAGVQLRFPSVTFIDSKEITGPLSTLYGEADHVFLSVGDDGRIIMSFDLADMWSEFHYEQEK